MTTERNGAVARSFATTVLPWLVGAGGLLVYWITVNRWISFLSLRVVTQISGWSWQLEGGHPLTLAVFYPFRWLPEPMIPLALNLFTSGCAALVLAFLARSVALLPHDLTSDEPLRKDKPVSILSTPTAWMPPVLTAILCGLQLSFWEHATSASGEMIDLLIFAYVARCLLEFGIDRDQSWLSRCAFVYAAGMANNWAMVGYLPVFVAAILRTKGLRRSLGRRFLIRMALWGLAGLSLYLLLPLVLSFSSHGQMNFWTALKLHLKSQEQALAGLRAAEIRVLALTSLLPLLLLSIRWKSHKAQLGDDTPLGVFLAKTTGHLVHALFFVISLWVALDPTFSPRHLNLGPPMLTYYYISALVFGYCAGYFLLLDSRGALKRFSKLPTATGWVMLCALPAALLWRNLDQMEITNGPAVHEFARQLYADLPAGKSVVLSENGSQLLLLQAELGAHGHEKDPLLLNTTFLPFAGYHVFMASQFKSRWPVTPPTNRLGVVKPFWVRELVFKFAAHETVVYLHPSSGLLTEPFTDQPRGLIHYLVPCQGKEVARETLGDGIVVTNEQIWEQRWTNSLKTLAEHTKEKPGYGPAWMRPLLRCLRLTRERNFTASVLGAAYSKSLDYWGVEMQRLGRWTEAGVRFERALALNPDNLSAQINLLYNERFRRGDKARLEVASVAKQLENLFTKYEDWPDVLNANGPVDEPTFLFRTARVLLPGGNLRQAVRAFMRCSELAPDWIAPKLWLARSYLRLRDFTEVLELTDSIQGSSQRLRGPGLAELLYCRATAMRQLGQTNEAAAYIESFLGRYREQGEVLSSAADLYAESGQLEQELALLDELLKGDPNQAELLAKKGLVQLQLSRYDDAIATLTKALLLAPSDDDARLLRAVAYSGAGQLDAARDDYQELLKTTSNSENALFGLGGIAWRKHDTNAAIEFYQQYLSNAISQSPQYAVASERFKQLKEGRAP